MLKIMLKASLGLMLASSFAHGATLYIQSQKAYLLDAPKFSATKLLKLEHGTPVNSIQTQGNWHQVTVQGQAGWLSKLLLKPHPPLERVSILETADNDFKESVRRRSSSIVTAGAARGLASEERSRIHQNNEANYFALKKVETLTLDQSELDLFAQSLESGKR
ncbi:SH3 domain-containing protein [Oceanospirillum sanctuarii]|uniref:SH3 domain-containing protein n=1 Tax=Oceanospirillum sanctuarii TaxID=1434821 RepID=UPI000A3A53E8|nr:SH3 domain-containing protein [Oceanospirillum sanctuarii]